MVLSSSDRRATSETCGFLSTMTLHRAPFRLAGWNSLMNRNLLRSPSPSRSCAFASSQAAMGDPENSRELFEYTSGRWMYVLVQCFVHRSF